MPEQQRRDSVEVYVSVGSNVDAPRNIRMACRELDRRFRPLKLSSVYRNAAVGFDGDDFLNMVIGFRTRALPEEIVAQLERLHALAGRVRTADPFSPRTLDLDLLLYGSEVIHGPAVHVPREDVTRYGFVLGPLAEIAPDLRHPVNGRTMAELWADFDKTRNPITPEPFSLQ